MSEDFDTSQEETGFHLLETKLGSHETSIFSPELTLRLRPTSSAGTPLCHEQLYDSWEARDYGI